MFAQNGEFLYIIKRRDDIKKLIEKTSSEGTGKEIRFLSQFYGTMEHIGYGDKQYCDTNHIICYDHKTINHDTMRRLCSLCYRDSIKGNHPKYDIKWRCGFITNKKKRCKKIIKKSNKFCTQHCDTLYSVFSEIKMPDDIKGILFEYL